MATTPATPAAPPLAAPARRPRLYYGYWIVGAAMVSYFVSVGTHSPVGGVFLKPMNDELGWTRAEFVGALTVAQFVTAFAGFFIGVYVDRYGARVLMVGGATMVGAALFLAGEVTALWQWMLLQGVLFAVGSAVMGNLVVNVTVAKWFVEKRGMALSMAAMGVPLGIGIVPPLMTAFVDEFGWRAGFRALAVAAWLLIYPVAMVMRRQPEDYGWHPDGRSDEEVRAGRAAAAEADYANSFTRREALRTRALYLIIIAFGFSSVALGTMMLQTIPFLTDEGFERGTAALMMSAYAVTSWVGKPAWGFLLDRMTVRYLAAFAFASQGVAVIVIVIGGTTGSVPVVAAGYLLLGVGGGGAVPLQEVIWASYFGRRYLGSVRSVGLPLTLLISASAPLAASYYFDVVGDYYGAFFAVAGITMLAALVIMMARRPLRPGARPEPAAPPEQPPSPPSSDDGMQPGRRTAAAPVVAATRGGDGAAPVGPTDAERAAHATEVVPAPLAPRPRRDYMGGRR